MPLQTIAAMGEELWDVHISWSEDGKRHEDVNRSYTTAQVLSYIDSLSRRSYIEFIAPQNVVMDGLKYSCKTFREMYGKR